MAEIALLTGLLILLGIWGVLREARRAPTVYEDHCLHPYLLRDGRACPGPCALDGRGRAPCDR